LAFPFQPAAAFQREDIRLTGYNRLSFYNNNVTGSGRASSFLTRNGQFQNDFSVNADYPRGEDVRWALQFMGRATEDDRVDKRLFSVQKLSLDRWSSARRVSLGDVYSSFTQYSLNQGLKGLQWAEKDLAGWEVTGSAGLVKSRWDDFFYNNRPEALDRSLLAARVRRPLPLGADVGVHLVFSRDNRTPRSVADEYSQRLVGLNWAPPSNSDFSLSGESAWSRAEVDRATLADNVKKGSAHKIQARSRFGQWRSSEEFENVSSDFVTTGGAAAPDLRRFETRNRFALASGMEGLVNAAYYRNNLNGQIGDTARTAASEGGLRWLAVMNRPSLIVESRLRRRKTTHSSSLGNYVTQSGILSAEDHWGPANGAVEYEYRTERRGGTQKNVRHVWGLSLSGFHRWREIVFRPLIRWNLDQDQDKTLSATNNVRESTLRLAADFPFALTASLQYRHVNVEQKLTDDTKRHLWDLRLGYQAPWRAGDSLEFGYRDYSNDFSTSSKNYRESVTETSYVHKF
jgi:hypothetical protein